MNDSNKGISNDGRLTVVLFFLFGLLLFDFISGYTFPFFHKNKERSSCEQLRFVSPDKLVVENCLNMGLSQRDEFITARVTPLLFAAMPINSASTDMLMTINGVGPAMANDIVNYRHQFGPFTSNLDLLNIHGIGPKRAANFATVFTFTEVP